MKLKSVTLQNFRTFKEKQTFNLENFATGFYFIAGQNLDNPRVGSNGCGKSTLIESITACFFGKTSTNLKADNLINWNLEKNEFCEVSVILEKQDINYCIQRTWKPNTLTLTNINTSNSETIIQEKLEEFLGCNFESFLYSTHIAQFTSKFLDLRPAEKMEVFTSILSAELEKWDDLSDLCKNKVEESDKCIVELKQAVNVQEGILNTLLNTNYENEIKKWENEKQYTLSECNKQVDNINLQIINIKNTILTVPVINLTVSDNKIKDCNEKLKEIEKQYDDLELEQTILDTDLQKAINEITILKTTLDINKKEQGKFNITIEDFICPYCKQAVDKNHITNELSKLKNKIDKITNEIVNYQEIKNELIKKIENIKVKFKELEKIYNKITEDKNLIEKEKIKDNNKIQEFKLQQTLIENKLNACEKEKNDLITKKNSYNKTSNPFLKLKENNDYDIKVQKRLIKINKLIITEQEEIIEPIKYWIKAFKEIKLLILEEKLKELEIYINNILNSFGIGDWKIILNTFNETKSGNIRNEFNILIESPTNSKPVPFECWGGGLSQRLRLAVTLGLMSFIQNSKVDFGVEFFDEPTAWLSTEGIKDLLDILYNRALKENKKIFIIDHKSLATLGIFNSIITIIKNKKESKITYI